MNLLGLLAADPDPAQKEFRLFEPGSTFWLPPQAADTSWGTDTTFYFIYWVSVFFFLLIVALMVYFSVRYRRRTEDQPPESNIKHNTGLEITWTVIPLILVIAMFYMGFRGFVSINRPPADAIEIYAIGKKWAWEFRYPNGARSPELHLEQDRPFVMILESNDVTHSLYIPAFRVKKDVVPGRYNKAWFEPTQAGEFRLFCTEYCGTGHSDMVARVVVHEPGLWEPTVREMADIFRDRPLHETGRILYSGIGACYTCHSIDGSANVGPSFQYNGGSIFGKEEVVLVDGQEQTIVVDENYLRESILYPNVKIVKGYDAVMNSYLGQLDDREITALIEFIKSLDPDYEVMAPADPNDPNAPADVDPNAPAAGDPNAPADPNAAAPSAADNQTAAALNGAMEG